MALPSPQMVLMIARARQRVTASAVNSTPTLLARADSLRAAVLEAGTAETWTRGYLVDQVEIQGVCARDLQGLQDFGFREERIREVPNKGRGGSAHTDPPPNGGC
ncbi:hypothetical protein ACFLT5_03495 [Chloroflexota bacterium]